jgi:hypothetical protein
MGKLGIDDVDDLSGVTLLAKDREVLFAQQSECTFIFNRSGGWPLWGRDELCLPRRMPLDRFSGESTPSCMPCRRSSSDGSGE